MTVIAVVSYGSVDFGCTTGGQRRFGELIEFIPNIGPLLSVIPMLLALLDAPWKAGAVTSIYRNSAVWKPGFDTLNYEARGGSDANIYYISSGGFASFFGF